MASDLTGCHHVPFPMLMSSAKAALAVSEWFNAYVNLQGRHLSRHAPSCSHLYSKLCLALLSIAEHAACSFAVVHSTQQTEAQMHDDAA